jgi:alcohol dehydrogenase class IV
MVWHYLSPQIGYGENALDDLLSKVTKRDRVSIVTDHHVKQSDFFRKLLKDLSHVALSAQVFGNVNSTPKLSTVRNCATFLSKTSPKWIIGVGGGSVLDTAKAARLLYEDPTLSSRLNPKDGILLERNVKRHRCLLVAIPTTTGTGSESTYGMVIRNPSDGLFLLASYGALVDYVVLDVEGTSSLPKATLAATAMDALGQSIEAYTSNLKNDFSDGHALVCAKLIFTWLVRAYTNPGDVEARHKLQVAACLSGLAFGNAPGGLAHAVADACCASFDFHHGRAVGIALPYVMEFNAADAECRSLYVELADHIRIMGSESFKVRSLIGRIRALQQTVGLAPSMKRAGIRKAAWESAMQRMAHRTLEDGVLKNRRPFDEEDAIKILRCVWDGRHAYF